MMQAPELESRYDDIDFIMLAERGGVRFTDKPWERGTMVLAVHGIHFTSENEKIVIPVAKIKWIGRPVTGWKIKNPGSGQIIALDCEDDQGRPTVMLASCPQNKIHEIKQKMLRFVIGTIGTYYIYPYSIGGVLQTKKTWKKGFVRALEDDIFVMDGTDPNRGVAIPVSGILAATRKNVGEKKQYLILDYRKRNELYAVAIICAEQAMNFIEEYVGLFLKRMDIDVDLPPEIPEVATMLYSGNIDSIMMEQMMCIDCDQLEKIYDDMLAIGMAKVVRMRRELALTNKGLRYVIETINKEDRSIETTMQQEIKSAVQPKPPGKE